MTVMLLQRSVTSQSTQSQKIGKKANGDCSVKPPFLFLLDDRQECRYSTDTAPTIAPPTATTTNNNNSNNNNNNNNENNENDLDLVDIVNLRNNNNNNNNNIDEKKQRHKQEQKQRQKNDNDADVGSIVGGKCSREYVFVGGRGGRGDRGGGGGGVEEAATSLTSLTSVASERRAGCGEDVAMRYYRLWIYACNVVLLGSAVGFAAAVSRTLLFTSDPRRHVVPGVPRAFDPTALYAYLALATQLGLVQLLGCIAARKLSARLLNAYWVLLLALLFGDAVIGVAWVFRFERMRAELRPTLRLRLQMEYGKEARFSEQWDRLQKEFTCCGVTGPRDFGSRWPQSCCAAGSAGSAGSSASSSSSTGLNGSEAGNGERLISSLCQQPFARGCEESVTRWLRKTADLLFVLGFCVIAFAKLCFLGILRYEIREMIQKIRLLREPPPPPTPFAQHPPFSPLLPETINNGSIAPRRTTLTNPPLTPSGNASLLLQQEECNAGRHPLLANNLQDGGADSDTNSHCALILEETTPTSTNHNCNSGGGGGGGTRCEKSNGNNNYEMREFNRRLLLSNGGSPAAGLTTGLTTGLNTGLNTGLSTSTAHTTRRT